MSMLLSLSVSPSTVPFTITWWPACAATLSCASTTYTFLSASFTNTYLAPCSLTHLVVHSPALSFAPFTPHWLSEIQPVQELSAAIASAPANSVAATAIENRTFMLSPSREIHCGFWIRRAAPSLAQGLTGVHTLPTTYYGEFLFPDERQQKREDSLESSPVLCAPRSRCSAPAEIAYCPDVAVLAEVAPAAFGTLK